MVNHLDTYNPNGDLDKKILYPLFLICAKGLSPLLRKAERDSLICGVAISRGGSRVSHLFFQMIVSFSTKQQLLTVLLYRIYSMNMKELRVKKLMETRQPYFFVTILQMLLGIGLLIFFVQLLHHNLRNIWSFLPLLEEQRRELLMKSKTKFGEDCKAGNKNYYCKFERNTHQGNYTSYSDVCDECF